MPLPYPSPTWAGMISRRHWKTWLDSRPGQWTQFGLGILLMLGAVVIGPLPGPGGVFLAAAGLTLILKTSLRARRHYVRFKRWQPKAGDWMDWGLRRDSAKRRRERKKGPARPDLAGGAPGSIPAPRGFEPVPLEPRAIAIERPARKHRER